ncbi:MAG: amino acid ABC transporter permease [Anaerolineae bacterium]
MTISTPGAIERRSTITTQRIDWRYAPALGGALLIVLSYFLPMFTERITAAVTRFDGGTTIESDFSVLINGQHFAQSKRPKGEHLEDIQVQVAPVNGFAGTGWGWLIRSMGQMIAQPHLISYVIVLLLPILNLPIMGWLFYKGRRTLWRAAPDDPDALDRYGPLVSVAITLSGLGVLAIVLAWLHQFDFSTRLLKLAGPGLMPSIGYWGALLSATVAFVGALSLRSESRRDVTNWWALVFVVALGIWLLVRFRPYPFLEIWNFVADGILVTLRIVVTSFGFIILVSLLGGLGRISRSPIIYGISSLYVELIRGIPLLVQLLFIWFALPQVLGSVGGVIASISPAVAPLGERIMDIRLDPFTAAMIGLTICYGAYGSEIFRAGISSIHQGQMEAARSLGMTYIQAMRYVILPQAVRVILPPIGNEFVALLKDSSLVSVLAVSDLTRRGREYMARTFLSFDTWILVALCYLVMTLFSSRAVEFIESKTRFER